jgi:endonuclease/exonuclease/phosphatase family metal-dependent hydrolase
MKSGSPSSLPSRLAQYLLNSLLSAAAFVTVVIYSPLPVPFLEAICGNQIFRLALLVIVGLLLFHYLAARIRWGAVVAALIVVVLLVEVWLAIPFLPAQRAPKSGGPVRLLTYNTHGTNVTAFLTLLDSGQVDIACYEEVLEKRANWSGYLHKEAERRGYYDVYQRQSPEEDSGILILSREPVTLEKVLEVPSRQDVMRQFMVVKTRADGRDVRIVGVHLASVEYDGISGSPVTGWSSRLQQARLLKSELKALKGPLIIMGDFNTTPTDRVFRILKGGFKDAWREGGRFLGLGASWHRYVPLFRIDHILYRGFSHVRRARMLGARSDHYALKVDLYW